MRRRTRRKEIAKSSSNKDKNINEKSEARMVRNEITEKNKMN
jgi:hypothetical protein